jgi:FkbM family methyltransferase
MESIVFLKKELERILNYCCEKEKSDFLFFQKYNRNLDKLGIIREILRKIVPLKIKEELYSYFRKSNKNLWQVSSAEKKWALDFLIYIIEKNPIIPYEFFPRKDHEEITKFVRNKILISFFDYIPQKELFDENDLKKQKEWEIVFKKNKINKKKEYYEFMGFKSKVSHFEPDIFFEKYGLNFLNSKEKLRNSTIIDCGAYIGDSAFVFKKELNPKKIICIEPDEKNFDILIENIKLNNLEEIIPIKIAIGKQASRGDIYLSGLGSYISESKNGNIQISTIDNLIFDQLKIDNVGLIKMDIEGFEFLAIKGAEKTIKNFKPILIICVYHKGQDFFEIPNYLKKIVPEYKFSFININFKSPIFERILIAQL